MSPRQIARLIGEDASFRAGILSEDTDDGLVYADQLEDDGYSIDVITKAINELLDKLTYDVQEVISQPSEYDKHIFDKHFSAAAEWLNSNPLDQDNFNEMVFSLIDTRYLIIDSLHIPESCAEAYNDYYSTMMVIMRRIAEYYGITIHYNDDR